MSIRDNVLQWLIELPTRPDSRVLSGQHVSYHLDGFDAGYARFITALYVDTGIYPAILGVPVDGLDSTNISHVGQTIIDYWNAGGIAQVDLHPRNPWTDGDCKDRSYANLIELLNPTTQFNQNAHDYYMNELSQLGDLFQTLKDAGVVVFWRVFGEMNYDSYYWYDSNVHPGDPGPWIAMWQHQHDYFTNVRGLDNLIWVYNPANTSQWAPVERDYPGDAYVDVVGLSVYAYVPYAGARATMLAYPRPDLGPNENNYTALMRLGKPFAIAEGGPRSWAQPYDNTYLIDDIRTTFPASIYFQNWHSWQGNPVAIVDNANAVGLLNDSWVLNQGDLDWTLTPALPDWGAIAALHRQLAAEYEKAT